MTDSLQIHLGHLSNAQLRNLLASAEAKGRHGLARAIRDEFARRRGLDTAIRRSPPVDVRAPEEEPGGRREPGSWLAAAAALLLIVAVTGIGLWQRDWVRRALGPGASPAIEATAPLRAPRAQVAIATPPPATAELEGAPAAAPEARTEAPQARRAITRSRPAVRHSETPAPLETARSATELAHAEPEVAPAGTEPGGAVDAGVLAVSRSAPLADAECGEASDVTCRDGRRASQEPRARRLADQPVKLTIPRAMTGPGRAGAAGPPR